eukprot:TRINITY_DN603_c0_g1_i1.p1 TRINITY_DN603_c0_g1~~TRINITY_DN603_c0_g1_i1.p1  ORF type:complete len:118 (+),score=14.32 TRINITY_DN603_c0_g1_i1:176-529(+)
MGNTESASPGATSTRDLVDDILASFHTGGGAVQPHDVPELQPHPGYTSKSLPRKKSIPPLLMDLDHIECPPFVPDKPMPPLLMETGSLDHIECPPFCLLYTSPSPRDRTRSRMPSSA